jgi:hypothetical protein
MALLESIPLINDHAITSPINRDLSDKGKLAKLPAKEFFKELSKDKKSTFLIDNENPVSLTLDIKDHSFDGEEINKENINFIYEPVVSNKSEINYLLNSFETLQKWEGNIVSIGENEFTAEIFDLKNDNVPEEILTLPISHINKDDIDLLKLGAGFYLSVGHKYIPNGMKKGAFVLRFKRLPNFTLKQKKAIQEETARLKSLSFWTNNESTSGK